MYITVAGSHRYFSEGKRLNNGYSDSPKGSSDAVVPGVWPDQMLNETCDACYSALCVLSSLPTAMHFIII
ncbi:hypothetical protein E5288_WYG018645 [Bos mutus]|uniref:Uncharacterized protein n=1 Tax=Bos mutus TaxID=72004 RepID=A0A6B0R6M0_9CETA|nr:hypothetical protein [Bos mutus]